MIKLVAFVAALGLVAAPAVAQRRTETETGSRLPIPKRAQVPERRADLSDPDNARVVLAEFARCTLDRSGTKVIAALRMPMDAAWAENLGKTAVGECLGYGQMRFAPQLYRGALFAELYRRRLADEAAGRQNSAAIHPVDAAALLQSSEPFLRDSGIVLAFAQCVIESDRADANTLITATVASKMQSEAYGKLVPLLGSCLPKGSTIRLSKPVLEGAVAEVLYRGVAAPQIASKAP